MNPAPDAPNGITDVAVAQSPARAPARQSSGAALFDPNAWAQLREQAAIVVKSGLLPGHVDTPEKAITLALAGQSLGLDMMESIRGIHILDGRPELSGALMLRLIRERCPAAQIKWVERTPQKCTIRTQRPNQDPAEFTYTIEDAKSQELLGRKQWKRGPRAMLQWRAVSEMARAEYSDVLFGCYVEGELSDEVEGDVIPLAEVPPIDAQSTTDPPVGPQDWDLLKALWKDIAPQTKWGELCKGALGGPSSDPVTVGEAQRVVAYLRELAEDQAAARLDQGGQ